MHQYQTPCLLAKLDSENTEEHKKGDGINTVHNYHIGSFCLEKCRVAFAVPYMPEHLLRCSVTERRHLLACFSRLRKEIRALLDIVVALYAVKSSD